MNSSLEEIASESQRYELIGSEDERERSIRRWLRAYLSEALAIDAGEIEDSSTLERYGLDSSAAVTLAADLGTWLGCDVDPSVAYDYPSIAELARALARAP